MTSQSLIVRGSIEDFQKELRDAVDLTSDRLPNIEFYLEARTPEEPDTFPILMKVVYPDQIVASPAIFDWGPSPREEIVHGAVRCRVFGHGHEELRVTVEPRDPRADTYCSILAAEIAGRWPAAWSSSFADGVPIAPQSAVADGSAASHAVLQPDRPPAENRGNGEHGQPKEIERKRVKPEIRKRAELAAAEKARDPSLSYEAVATRLTQRLDRARDENVDLQIGNKESISRDDVKNCLRAMREIEPDNPKWRWTKGDAAYRM